MGKDSKHAVCGVPQTSDKVCTLSSFQHATLYCLEFPKLPLKVTRSRWPPGSSCQPTRGYDTGLGLADVWPHHMNHNCLSSSTRPGSSLNAKPMIQELQRKHFLQLIRFAACKANFKRWAVPDANEKVCACSVIQGVWPRFSFTTKLTQHLYYAVLLRHPMPKVSNIIMADNPVWRILCSYYFHQRA